jgi:hypothetical protein
MKLLSRIVKQSGKAARLHLPQHPALLLFQLLILPRRLLNRLLSEEGVRLNPYKRTKPGAPVDQTLFPDTEDRGDSMAITLSGPVTGPSSTLAASVASIALIAKEPFDFLCENYMSGGGTRQNMS